MNTKYEYSNKVYQSIKNGEGRYKIISKYEMFIGIDPDVEKSGFAIWVKKEKLLSLANLSFFEIFERLNMLKENNKVLVVIEAGWLNKGNWHIAGAKSRVSAKIGSHTGANHQVGKQLDEMCEFLDIEYQLSKPTKSKVKADKFKMITGYQGRTNPEVRDAGMLVYGK